jgi:phosphatidyl-myo-inositol dimannoside synthase
MTLDALVLAPLRGSSGGIERYVQSVEWAFASEGVNWHRIDLNGSGPAAHARMLAQCRRHLPLGKRPVRLVVAHRALLPVASLIARQRSECGISLICHGMEVWGTRSRARSMLESHLMRKPAVRAVAVSSFTAGALSGHCTATILPPGLSQEWFDTLLAAAVVRRDPGIRLVTTFRLADWRAKGLPEILQALGGLRIPEVRLTVCGSGTPPNEMVRMMERYPFCSVRSGISDSQLAAELAAADLFVLATRTRFGASAYGEGFGLVLLEAQVAGTPVVAPAYGGSHDAFVEGVTGVAPADESAGSLARALKPLLEDPQRLAHMGKCAAEWAREKFAPDRYAALALARLL